MYMCVYLQTHTSTHTHVTDIHIHMNIICTCNIHTASPSSRPCPPPPSSRPPTPSFVEFSKVSALVYLLHVRLFENLLPSFVEKWRRRRPMLVPPVCVCVCVCVCVYVCVCVCMCVHVCMCRQKFSKVRIQIISAIHSHCTPTFENS